MAQKKETALEMDDVLKVAKKFVKQGKLDELAEAWVDNNEKAEQPNQVVNLLGQVGQFIIENDVEEKLEDLLTEGTKKKTTTKKTTTKKSSSSTKKKTTAKKTTTKKTTTTKKKTTTTKKSSTKKSTTKKK